MQHSLRAAIAFVLIVACGGHASGLSLVPSPSRLVRAEQPVGGALVPARLRVACPDDQDWREHASMLLPHLERLTGRRHEVDFDQEEKAFLTLRKDASLALEAYRVDAGSEGVTIEASSLKGLSNATATLLQLCGTMSDGSLPIVRIEDAPETPYRSFMIDMGRNPHSVELLKETIDFLWYYKVDSLQLHLTDDQRFAFPSKAFPGLWDGLITAEEFREIERYAYLRGVSLIPELEVPGHSGMLRSRYPEVFGTSATELAKSDKALQGIKTLLDEMLDLFPSSPYIHIGGDEAFGVPEDLQRDLINKLHAYLESKGRQTVVWEGPAAGKGDNKVHRDVIHMNWRMVNYGPDEMLADGYRVVNAAWDPLYLVDHYPRINFTMTSPQWIYETLKLTRFKHVNPAIRTYAHPIEVGPSDRLIGFCMPWWEGRESNYFAQVFPRIVPFAEVAWRMPPQRDYASFAQRSEQAESTRLRSFYPIEINAEGLAVDSDGVFHTTAGGAGLIVTLAPRRVREPTGEAEIRYTLDGSVPRADSIRYTEPIQLRKSGTVRAALFSGGEQVGHASRRDFRGVTPQENLALGKPAVSSVPSAAPFSVERVTDGDTDNLGFYLGYPTDPTPIEVTVDLEQERRVSRVVVHAYTISDSFEKYSVEVSRDGKQYEQVGTRLEKPELPTPSVEHRFEPRDIRFVRIRTHGNKGYVFDSFSKITEIQAFE